MLSPCHYAHFVHEPNGHELEWLKKDSGMNSVNYGLLEWEQSELRSIDGDLHGKQIIFYLVLFQVPSMISSLKLLVTNLKTFSPNPCPSGPRNSSLFMNHHRPLFLTIYLVAKPSTLTFLK